MLRTKLAVTTAIAISALLLTAPALSNVTFNEREPFNFIFFNACTGEDVLVDGIFHEVVREKFRSDGSFSLVARINAHGNGIGLSSGSEYVWNDTFVTEVDDPPTIAFSFSQTSYLRLIGKGQTANALIRIEFLFRVNPDGTIDFVNMANPTCVAD